MSGLVPQETLDRIALIPSKRARIALLNIAEGIYSGRLSSRDVELLGGLADRLEDRSEAALADDELVLVQNYRRLTARQREGAIMMLSAFAPELLESTESQ